MNGRRNLSVAKLSAALAVLAVVGGIGAATTVKAKQLRSGTDAQQRACAPDVFRLCSAYIPFEAPITACLQRNKRKLNPQCRKVFEGKL